MTGRLDTSDLSDVVASLKEVATPYQLGVQLKIDTSDLDKIEKNYPGNIGRQKTEVIKYWLRNSRDASWTTLANAVERMGGHANLVERLRSKEKKSEEETQTTSANGVEDHEEESRVEANGIGGHAKPVKMLQERKQNNAQTLRSHDVGHEDMDISREDQVQHRQRLGSVYVATPSPSMPKSNRETLTMSLNEAVCRDILILGKKEHGKSTLGNKILNACGYFKIGSQDDVRSQTRTGSAMLDSASQLKKYKFSVYDHNGLFEDSISSVNTRFSDLPAEINLVTIVLKQKHMFNAQDIEVLEAVVSTRKVIGMSALVITHCESLSEEEREKMIEQFKKDYPSVDKLMGKGILAVGFPDSSHIQPGSQLSQMVEDDKKKLRELIYRCEEKVTFPQSEESSCSIS